MFAQFLRGRSQWQKRLIAAAYDFVAVLVSLWLAFYLRLVDTVHWADIHRWEIWIVWGGVLSLPVFYASGLYRLVIRHASFHLFWLVARGVAFSALAWGGMMLLLRLPDFPRSVILIYWFIAFVLLATGRLLAGSLLRHSSGIPVVIYGAGVRGAQLATALQHDPTYIPVAFIDDQPHLAGNQIANLRVYNSKDFARLHERYQVKEVLVAIQFDSNKERNSLLHQFKEFPVRVNVLPSISELAQRKLRAYNFEQITANDLLGRDQVAPNEVLLKAKIAAKCVLVTGAGGSIGAELCRQAATLQPSKIVLLDYSEPALYEIERRIRPLVELAETAVVPVLASVCDRQAVARVLAQHSIDTIYHAAAYKHVPLVEQNPLIGIHNNVFGTLIVAQEAIRAQVETMILISTDKAVRPISVMGTSKRLSEMLLQALSVEHPGIALGMVRFGNVLDSSGSVVPLFREQIDQKGPLTVTHADMTRYFMTQREAVELTIQAGAMSERGDIFVLEMGEPVKIEDLARMIIHLSGYQLKNEQHPDGDIEIQYIGVRPGEKITEELLISGETSKTDHPKILKAHDGFMPWSQLRPLLEQLETSLLQHETGNSVKLLKAIVQKESHQAGVPSR